MSDLISPDRAYHNLTSYRSPPSAYSFQDEPFGLTRFWPQNPPERIFEVNYRETDGSDPQILLACVIPDRWTVYPACSGRVHFVADDLAFFVVFPREELSHWHDIVLAVRELYKSWRASP
jgi:hypothetical protein